MGSLGLERVYPNARLQTAPGDAYIQALIAWRPYVVHSQCEFSTFLPARKIAEACGCPLVHTYHTVYEDFTHYFSPSVRFGKYMAALFSRKTLSKVQAVIAPTEKVKTLLRGYGVKQPIAVQPTGLRLEAFEQIPEQAALCALKKSLGIQPEDRVLLYLGRLAREKNIDRLLLLLSQVKEPKIKLLLAGDGPDRQRLEALRHTLGLDSRVLFAGIISPSAVARYYRLGDIFVSASQSETQGLTYVEAMASGLPLLCREDPCLTGVLENGVNGFAFKSAQAFLDKLHVLLSDSALRRSMGDEARSTAFARFSSRSFAAGVLSVYRQALKKAAASDPKTQEELCA